MAVRVIADMIKKLLDSNPAKDRELAPIRAKLATLADEKAASTLFDEAVAAVAAVSQNDDKAQVSLKSWEGVPAWDNKEAIGTWWGRHQGRFMGLVLAEEMKEKLVAQKLSGGQLQMFNSLQSMKAGERMTEIVKLHTVGKLQAEEDIRQGETENWRDFMIRFWDSAIPARDSWPKEEIEQIKQVESRMNGDTRNVLSMLPKDPPLTWNRVTLGLSVHRPTQTPTPTPVVLPEPPKEILMMKKRRVSEEESEEEEEEVDRPYSEKRRCYECHKVGHIARDCPNPRKGRFGKRFEKKGKKSEKSKPKLGRRGGGGGGGAGGEAHHSRRSKVVINFLPYLLEENER